MPLEGFEPPTRCLGRSGSSTELQRQALSSLAADAAPERPGQAMRRKSLVASTPVLAVTAAIATNPASAAAGAPSTEASVVT